jgi:dihydrofolate reductase
MASGHVYIATSLDGFVARKDHGIDWLDKYQDTGEDLGFEPFMDSVDGLVMGRGSFETIRGFGFWPYTKPVIVMTKTLTLADVPEELQSKVELTDLEPKALMEALSARGWSRVYVDGGKVVQSFLRLGLIEELILTTVPVLIGGGISLFGELERDVQLEVVSSKGFESGLVQTHYRVLSSTALPGE